MKSRSPGSQQGFFLQFLEAFVKRCEEKESRGSVPGRSFSEIPPLKRKMHTAWSKLEDEAPKCALDSSESSTLHPELGKKRYK